MMTPGFAKPRAELPWLPYGECNRVIINAHNFTPATFSPAVNGKMPVAAWIPTRDTVGNGTTTLTDLVGTNNGTLTNMDPATDWVSDTDAGGTRALDFDGSDRVFLGNISASVWSFSAWTRVSAFNTAFRRIFGQNGFQIDIAFSASGVFACFDGTAWRTFGTAVTLNQWLHHVITYDGSSLRAYRNGSQIGSTTTGGRSLSGVSRFGDYVGGPVLGDGNQFIGRLDDMRIWNQAINATDVSDLYAAQRGGDAS